MSEAAQQVVRTLFVTLRRSPIGVPHFHKRALKALGLEKRHDCVERANTASVRGALQKVAHLVRIETDAMFLGRRRAELEAARPLPPIRVRHDAPGAAATATSSGSGSSGSSSGTSSSPSSSAPNQQQRRAADAPV